MYYAYITPTGSGICYGWSQCRNHILGIPGSRYKKFSRLDDAQLYVGQIPSPNMAEYAFVNANVTNTPRCIIYTAGAVNEHSGYGIYVTNRESQSVCGYAEQDERYKRLDNGSTILAEVYAIYKTLEIYDDNVHIVTSNEYCYRMAAIRDYPNVDYTVLWNEIFTRTHGKNITIEWVKSNSGVRGNDIANALAYIGSNLL